MKKKREPSPYALVARRLIDLGYAALPVGPGTKVPGHYARGHWHKAKEWATKFLKRLPTQYEIAYREDDAKEPAGVCVVLGQSSRNLLVVDIDDEAVVNAIVAVLPHTPCIKRGAKGQSLIFRVEDTAGLYSTSFSRPIPLTNRRQRVVDILFEGRQTVLPPTIHPDTGQPYRWIGERALEQTPYEEIPIFTAEHLAKIAAALVPFDIDLDRDKPKEAPSDAEIEGPFEALKTHAYRHLDLWVPKLGIYKLQAKRNGYEGVAHWRPSNQGRPLAKRNRNLSISSNPEGIKDYGDGQKGYNPFQLTAACDVCPPGDEFMWLARTTNWGPEGVYHDPHPRQKPTAAEPPAETISGQDRELPAGDLPQPADAPKSPETGTIDVTKCPGLVGEIARFIVDSAKVPQPLLSIGAALTVVGTVAARQLAGPTRSGTSLYVVNIAPTGSGKDYPIKAISNLLTAANLERLIGPGKFTAERAVVNAVIREPCIVAPIDELGEFLARCKGRNAASHEKAISSMLRTLWGSPFDTVPLTERAGEMFSFLYSPALSIYGASTIEEFYDAISDADTRNGLLNRFLILENDVRPKEVDPEIGRDVPKHIAEGLRAIRDRLGKDVMNVHGPGSAKPAEPTLVPWRDEFAQAVYTEFREEIRAWMERDRENDRFIVRSAEMAVRIATIRAIGCDPISPSVNKEDMEWGVALARLSANTMIEGARDRISETYWEKVLNRIVVYGKKHVTITVRELQVSMKIKSKELKEAVEDLVAAGRFEKIDMTDDRSDSKKKVAYRFVR